MNTRFDLSAWTSRALEWGWLCCIVVIPSFFNLLSARHFEPDKALLLRAIVTVLAALAAAGWIARSAQKQSSRLRHTLPDSPITYSIVAYVVIFIFATVVSIVPAVSLWGSYQRLQGTYTNLAYIVLALLIVTHIRERAQLWRVLGALLLSSLIPSLYGLVQHFETDPLPWKGDVITRVASTMGNSIFIAAFLILIIPFLLATSLTLLRSTGTDDQPDSTRAIDLGAISSGIGAVCVVFTAIQFSGVLRTIDLRFWWVYPGAVAVAGIAFVSTLYALTAPKSQKPGTQLVPAILGSCYAMALILVGQPSADVKAIPPTDGRFGANWVWWLLFAVVCLWVPYFSQFFNSARTNPKQRHRLAAALCLFGAGLASLVIVFTQSRGPWIGGAVGVVFFCTLSLLELRKHSAAYHRLAQRLLITEGVVVLVLTLFLVIFNVSTNPTIEQLRKTPYIGRMGRLFDVSAGTTGDVRMKIWFGDEHGKGTIGLITADPLRTVIGWGPESMFVAYNAFYPPSLANIESRSASPDRSHEAFLDELVTKGLLGLLSYLAVIVTVIGYGLRLLRRPSIAPYRFFVIAALSAVVAHVVEGLTGIPVVSSLLVFWLAIAVLLTIGHLSAPIPEPAPADEPAPQPPTPATHAKAATGNRRRPPTSPGRTVNPPSATQAWVLPAAITVILGGVIGAWVWNLDNAYADMRFQQGTSYADAGTQAGNTDQQIIALSYFLDAIRMEPTQDYYYLSAGRSLLNLADAKRRMGGNSLPANPLTMAALLDIPTALELKSALESRNTADCVQLAAEFLQTAHALNPYNKDHFANLARLYTFWYTRVSQDPNIEAQIFSWYERGIANAPNDVSILNEYVGALVSRANRLAATDPTAAAALRTQAHTALDRSLLLDPTYTDTQIRIADLAYADGAYTTAVPLYREILQRDPHALDSQITTIADQLTGNPAVLAQLRDAYLQTPYQTDRILLSIIGLLSSRLQDYPAAIHAFGQLVALQPNSIEALQNYTIVLSNGLEYEAAALQAQNLVALANTQQLPAETVALYQQLHDFFVSKQP